MAIFNRQTVARLIKTNALRKGLLGGHPLWRAVWVAQLLRKGWSRISKGGEAPVTFSEPLSEGTAWTLVHVPEDSKRGRGDGRKFVVGPKRARPRATALAGPALSAVGAKILEAPSAERINAILGQDVVADPPLSRGAQRRLARAEKRRAKATAKAAKAQAKVDAAASKADARAAATQAKADAKAAAAQAKLDAKAAAAQAKLDAKAKKQAERADAKAAKAQARAETSRRAAKRATKSDAKAAKRATKSDAKAAKRAAKSDAKGNAKAAKRQAKAAESTMSEPVVQAHDQVDGAP